MAQTRYVDRRSFLSAAAAGAGVAFAAKAFGQESPSGTLPAALIGAGTQGQNLLNACMKIPGIHVKAVCDIWENYNQKQAARILTGFKQEHTLYSDYRDMLEKEKDLAAVIVATPDFCHAEQTVACLKAGLNVYCETPMANSIAGAREMAKAAKETGKLLQIGLQRRSNPKYTYCYEHIINETKLLGTLTALNGQWNQSVQTDRGWPRRAPLDDETLKKYGYASMQQFRNWRWYKEMGGGPLTSFGTHQIDVFNWYMEGPPKSVLASGGTDYYKGDSYECPDTVMAICEYEFKGGTFRAMYQTINANSNFGYYETFMGDQGTLHISEAPGRAAVYREPASPDWDKWVKIGILKEPEKPEAEKEKTETPDGIVVDVEESVAPPSYNLPVKFTDPVHTPHLANFFNAVKGQGKLVCPAETGFASFVTVMKINEAIASGNKINLTPGDFTV